MKRALAGVLPLRTLFKPKHGFSVPPKEWFRVPLIKFVKDTLLAPDARSAEWLNPTVTASICERNSTAIGILLNFELWLRHYLSSPTAWLRVVKQLLAENRSAALSCFRSLSSHRSAVARPPDSARQDAVGRTDTPLPTGPAFGPSEIDLICRTLD